MDFANKDRRQLTMAGTGFSVMLTLHYSFQLMSQHLFYWKNPKEQRAILIIILLPPLYAVNSFFGFIDARGSSKLPFLLLDAVKECYGALAIAMFLDLMFSYLKISITRNIVPDEIKKREIHLSFPMTIFLPRKTHLNHQTLRLLKNLTWQFVIIRPVCSILMLALQAMGMYPSWLSWAFAIVLNLSILLAIYSLVVFYRVFAKELEPHEPLSKFICIKGSVFFSIWQGVLLKILVTMGIIQSHHFWLETEHVDEAIQKVLVCVEMIMFAVLHQYAYYVTPYSGNIEANFKLQNKRD